MAFKAISNTTSANRIVFILLIFSIYPQIVKLNILLLLITQQVNVIKKAIVEILKL